MSCTSACIDSKRADVLKARETRKNCWLAEGERMLQAGILLHCVVHSVVGMPCCMLHHLEAHPFVRPSIRQTSLVLSSITHAAAADVFATILATD